MALPDHFLVSVDGSLYDTRVQGWNQAAPLRINYRIVNRDIHGMSEVKAALRCGAFTDIGGYPLYFVTQDGRALSFDSARKMLYQIADDFQHGASTGWRITGALINYEDHDLVCDHSGEKIPAAYDPVQWAAGCNVSGFMPDSEPSHHATWEEAKEDLRAQVELAREPYEIGSDEDDALARVARALEALKEGQELNMGAIGYRWWVERL
ncbi:DNA ligase [Caulobacter phage CcrSC]|uniref:Uncharacterized protein n=1 Tax=Caulobacter phage CcrSC TaxID=2283272 RepID=A0A385EGN9_9CAUD|nr:DNA ligase [Caulobacter phage CcrSC]YP_009810718.1 DNA ligase [Caulobacter phage CcrSC]AXQ69588.1 hypothetical protein CcrSC_gp506 [Caulobacter phage CcrSC]AXQ70088.1 hypothetical protein CcrSC_gp006 [Caulobacter phage CcrSC]